MKDAFFATTDRLARGLLANETLLCNLSAERSDFVRFNQGGRVVAPVAAMRFDDSIYRALGENLLDLTKERELLPDPSTYGERSRGSERLPGALLKALRFTL